MLTSHCVLLYCFDVAVDTTAPESETLNGNAGVTVGSGEGFNTLAGYLFGNNTQELAMDMTTPVNIDVSPTGGRWASNHVVLHQWLNIKNIKYVSSFMSSACPLRVQSILGQTCHIYCGTGLAAKSYSFCETTLVTFAHRNGVR